MFIAHLPAGYLWTRSQLNWLNVHPKSNPSAKYYVFFGLLCSVLPDFDLLYFYLIDHRQHEHHTYWTHIPLFWIAISLSLYAIGKFVLRKNLVALCLILIGNTWLHLFLDTVAGGIYWLYPLSETKYRIFVITARFDWWVWNYIIHWTFLFELLIISMFAYQLWWVRGRHMATNMIFQKTD